MKKMWERGTIAAKKFLLKFDTDGILLDFQK
jgi:hypothetical protein